MKRQLLFMVGLIFIFGCAAPPQRPEEPNIVWPLPPDKPRIKYIRSYSDTFDVEDLPGFLDKVLGVGFFSLDRPQGVAVDREGNVYVADSTQQLVVAFQPVKKKLKFMGLEDDAQRLSIPIGLAIADTWNMLFVASTGTKKVIGYDLATGRTKIVIGGFVNPVSVAVDEARGKIYVTDSKANELKVFDSSGRHINTIASKTGGGRGEDYTLSLPGQVATDRQGNVYVADTFDYNVKVYGPDGKFIKKIGQGMGTRGGQFSKLSGVAVDSEGHIYTVDTDFSHVQIFNQDGQLLLVFGKSGNAPGAFALPLHIYIDKQDRIYVADTFNKRVQVFQYLKEDASK